MNSMPPGSPEPNPLQETAVPSCWMQTSLRSLSCCFLLALLRVAPAAAQDPIPLDSLLFEPHPVPEGAIDGPLPGDTAQVAGSQEGDKSPDALYLLPGELEETVEETIDLYLENIAETEADNGPFAPALLEQYLSLGKAYQQNNQHEEAIAVLEKAEYISRINSGLFASEQFVIVENLIASYLAMGEVRKAADRQQYLLFLNQQNFGNDNLQAVPILQKLADWQMNSFISTINADVPFTISFSSGNSRTPAPREFAFSSLYLAQNTYFQAIQNLVKNNQLDNPTLNELELKLVEAVFLSANRQGLLANPDFYMDPRLVHTGSRIMRRNIGGNSISYVNGRNAYMRMRLYEEHQAAVNPLEVAQAIIGLGDWNLLFDRRTTALKYYEEADAYLHSHNVAEDVITELMNPELPPQLPLFTALPHSREKYQIPEEAPLAFTGYADVSFDLTRYGNVRNVEINNTSGEFSKNMERRLLRILRTTPFRPRLRDGKVTGMDNVRIRYYYADVRNASPAPQL